MGGYSSYSVQGEVTQMSLITTIEDLRKLAQKRVPRMFYDYADSGSWTESTYRANESDFAQIKFRQRVARNIDKRSIRATMIGQDMAMPVALAPHWPGRDRSMPMVRFSPPVPLLPLACATPCRP